MSVMILQGDARNIPLPDSCVDLIVTSPPYWQLRSYSDDGEHYEGQIGSEPTSGEFLDNLLDCTREWMRVLKSSGSLFINLGDKYGRGTRTTIHGGNSKSSYVDEGRPGYCAPTGNDKSLLGLPWRYALRCTDELGLILRAEIIWSKVNGLPESVTDRVRRGHEQVFHLVKQPKYFTAVDEIREPHSEVSVKRSGRAYNAGDSFSVSTPNTLDPEKFCNPLGKLPGSVWSIPSSPLKVPDWVGIDHFAAYPPELCRRIILGWSPKEICGVCGEGRKPVIQISHEKGWTRRTSHDEYRHNGESLGQQVNNRQLAEILGYACACTPYTDHPGTGEPTTFMGKYSEAVKAGVYEVLGNRKRTGPWREYHLDNWESPETYPSVALDPFGGTGTTAMVADVLGRTGISVDASYDYCKLARWRTSDPQQRAKVLGEKLEKVPFYPDQPSLFEEMQ
jgi:DNA modification methylase